MERTTSFKSITLVATILVYEESEHDGYIGIVLANNACYIQRIWNIVGYLNQLLDKIDFEDRLNGQVSTHRIESSVLFMTPRM